MRLDHALNKVPCTLVSQGKFRGAPTLLIRVPAESMPTWAEVVQDFVLAASDEQEKGKRWDADVSRVYFADTKSRSMRFLWRVTLMTSPELAAEALGAAIVRVMSTQVEVTSQPLVGRLHPSPGSTKGGHSMGTADAVVARHFTPG